MGNKGIITVRREDTLLYTVAQVSKMLNMSERSVYNAFDSGLLERVKIGNATRVTAASVKRLAGVK